MSDVNERILDGLHLELGYDPIFNANTYDMEFRFIPVGPYLESFVGLIENPGLRAVLNHFVLSNTQVVHAKQRIDRQMLEDVMPQLVPMVVRDMNENQLDELMKHLREIFVPKVMAFMNEKSADE